MSVRVGMVSLGCPKNQVDAEQMLYRLREHGYELVADAALADVVLINTCGFIESAKQESIETILEFCQLKKEGRIKSVIVTGCLAERYRDEILGEIPEASAVVGIGCNQDICDIIEKTLGGEQIEDFGDKICLDINAKRLISTTPYYAYLKIAEGCSNNCTYCAIPAIRGPFRSRPIESIVEEAEWLAQKGVKEVIVVAQDTTRYGEDLYGKSKLPELLSQLAHIDGFKWIRVLYCYPERITDELIDVFAKEEKIAKYIDIPIQHVNKEILKRMNRRGDEESLKALINKLRERVKGIIIRTTLITGFPGETEEQFAQLAQFVHDMKLDRLGCFAYSAEEGTPAAQFPDQIELKTREHRAEVIMDEQMRVSDEHNEAMVGKTIEVVVEGFDRYAECFFGRSYSEAPEIDGKIFFTSERKLSVGEFVNVQIDDILDYDLIGAVVNESSK